MGLVGLPGIFNNTHVELGLHRQNVITHLVDSGERIVFTPKQVSLESESGKTLDTRIDPRAAFAGQTADSKWDKLHAGYFSSYALWGYLTAPFLYTYTGFETQEIEPWHENGERWRVLQVTFPGGYAAHTRIQYVYFGEDGLVRRHLYTVDILGGSRGTNYAFEYRRVNGVMIAARRRVVASCLSGCFSKPQLVVYGDAAPSVSENFARVPVDVRYRRGLPEVSG